MESFHHVGRISPCLGGLRLVILLPNKSIWYVRPWPSVLEVCSGAVVGGDGVIVGGGADGGAEGGSGCKDVTSESARSTAASGKSVRGVEVMSDGGASFGPGC